MGNFHNLFRMELLLSLPGVLETPILQNSQQAPQVDNQTITQPDNPSVWFVVKF